MLVGDRPSVALLGGQRQLQACFSGAALERLAAYADPLRPFANRTSLLVEDRVPGAVFLLTHGWAAAYRHYPDGRRHVVEIYVAGDLIGLADAWAEAPGPAVAGLSEGAAVPFARDRLIALARHEPEVMAGITTLLARGQVGLARRLGSLARHTAYERVAYMLWSMRARVQPDRAARSRRFAFPVSQTVMSDALGLSTVHLNRSLRQLERAGVLRKMTHEVEILDEAALQRIVHGVEG